jgi:hypothetical protein
MAGSADPSENTLKNEVILRDKSQDGRELPNIWAIADQNL